MGRAEGELVREGEVGGLARVYSGSRRGRIMRGWEAGAEDRWGRLPADQLWMGRTPAGTGPPL